MRSLPGSGRRDWKSGLSHRDTQDRHAKRDELLHTQGRATNELTSSDDEEPAAYRKASNNAKAGD